MDRIFWLGLLIVFVIFGAFVMTREYVVPEPYKPKAATVWQWQESGDARMHQL